jgi:hypothetical protein
MQAKDDQVKLALEKSQAKSFEDMLKDAMAILETRIVAKGIVPAKALAAVVPEHSSPETPEQQATAKVATARAKLVAVQLALGLPARDAGAPHPTPAAVVTEQLRQDIAEVPEKVVDKIKESEQERQQSPGGPS